MNVEDSYEGAIERLRRLGHAGIHLSPPAAISQQLDEANQRLRDVEELATLACDENERLTAELDAARTEIARLKLQLTMREEPSAAEQYEAALQAVGSRGRGAKMFLAVCVLGAAAAAAFVTRPWEHARVATAAVAAPEPATPPVVTPPPATTPATTTATTTPATTTVPKVATPATTTVPKVATPATTTVPKVAATIPKAALVAAAPAARHHASKHRAAKRAHHEAKPHAAASKKSVGDTDDPLGGVNL